MPPLVVWKAARMQSTWPVGGPPGCQYSVNESGYMQDSNFEQWFLRGFIKATQLVEKPILLIYDGHGSHITYTTIKSAINNKVIILALPPPLLARPPTPGCGVLCTFKEGLEDYSEQ